MSKLTTRSSCYARANSFPIQFLPTDKVHSMCYAKSLRKKRDELKEMIDQAELPLTNEFPDFEPRYRIGPRQKHIILHPDLEDGYSATMAQWDLVPAGNPKPFLRANARDDALRTKWPWKMLLQHNRCITFADGFYEPEKPALSKEKAPWSFYAKKDNGVFFMPGLFTRPSSSDDELTYTIITTEANAALRVHDRMPVMLELEDALSWLQEPEPRFDLLRPYPADLMEGWRVGDEAKNSRGRDHPGLIEPVDEIISGTVH